MSGSDHTGTTKEKAESVVRAAIAWRWGMSSDPILNRREWELFEALGEYGDEYKGVTDD